MTKKYSFNDIQKAFVEGYITFEQLIEVLIDNYGIKKTKKILSHNIELALINQNKETCQS